MGMWVVEGGVVFAFLLDDLAIYSWSDHRSTIIGLMTRSLFDFGTDHSRRSTSDSVTSSCLDYMCSIH